MVMIPMKTPKLTQIILLSTLFLFFSTKSAHAYLDPGSGSYIIQLIIAGGVGALFTVKTFWLQIKNFFTSLFRQKNKQKEKTGSDPEKKNGV